MLTSARLAFRRSSLKLIKAEDLMEKTVPYSAFALFSLGISLSMFSLKQLSATDIRPSRLL